MRSAVPTAPTISVPKGGGALRAIDEKFTTNPATGTATVSVPLPISPARSGFGPQLSLSYDSGGGAGPFGHGWAMSIPAITRKTDKGLPTYDEAAESDVFLLSGAEDLVPVLRADGSRDRRDRTVDGVAFVVDRYQPRSEGGFVRIERWTQPGDGQAMWRTIGRDNTTTWYGRDAASRIADGERVYSWLACESYDDKGNALVFGYKAEDDDGIDAGAAHERHRPAAARTAQRYLKSVRYGNRASRLVQPRLDAADWLFELTLDYGEHDDDAPTPTEVRPWRPRADPSSNYRPGFEVRSYRLCRRVLMFHHFPDEPQVGRNCLVRALELGYQEGPAATFLASATARGYRRDGAGYRSAAMPSVEFGYSQAAPAAEVRTATADNLPEGVGDHGYALIDLDGEGAAGILAERAGAWFYQPAGGNGQFGPLSPVARIPATASVGQHQFVDLDGDGRLDVVDLTGSVPGFIERTDAGGWGEFTSFRHRPDLNPDDPFTRLVDLNGDGHADLMRTEGDAIVWHASLAQAGFGPAQRIGGGAHDDRPVLADQTQSVFLADMSGDGLADLVRIGNGDIRYWPSLGYGRFGPPVVMDRAPWFDQPDAFDPQRIRIADVDGTGPTDLIYLGADGIRLYRNQSGNSWSAAQPIEAAPATAPPVSVTVTDLLGTGTSCLVWSSPLPGDAPLRYLDLTDGVKPNLLTVMVNNMGAETRISYASSTRFYLADQAAGRPWLTRLPFPVQVVTRVDLIDHVARHRFVTRYGYRHGHFDGHEREFRGFGLVEQWDAEEYDGQAEQVPPVLTRTWYHTGAYRPDGDAIRYASEYYREPGVSEAWWRGRRLPEATLPSGLTVDEEREAVRALRGSVLRQETYGLDGSAAAAHPYQAVESSFTVHRMQPAGRNRHAVFRVSHAETVSYHYEREPADPRISHELTLKTDDYGNLRVAASVAYGRIDRDARLSAGDQAAQAAIHITLTEHDFTNDVGGGPGVPDAYRTPVPFQTRVYEVTGLAPTQHRLAAADLIALTAEPALAYDQSATAGLAQRRLIDHRRTVYRRDDLTGPLPLGHLGELALPDREFRLALTPSLISTVYGARVTAAMLTDGGYVHSEGDLDWWLPSGRVWYSVGPGHTAAQELAYARAHFFVARRFTDPFGHATIVHFDPYDLLVLDVVDPVGNHLTAGNRDATDTVTATGNDYRFLQPALVTDANGNRTAVAHDALGFVTGLAVMGKPAPAPAEGDSLNGFAADLTAAETTAYLADPLANGGRLGQATTRFIYDLFAFARDGRTPPTTATLARELHAATIAAAAGSPVRHSIVYHDGMLREMQTKGQAEPGPLRPGEPDLSHRWVGTGWTVLNNKALPVRRYEPFFSADHRFEYAPLVGVSAVICYDPLGRPVATVHPEHTYDKVVFDPWSQQRWDANDTIGLGDPAADLDVGPYLARLSPTEYAPTWYERRRGGGLGPAEQIATQRSLVHSGTPTVAHVDALGRPFLTVAHNRYLDPAGATIEEHPSTRVRLDIEGNPRELTDAANRVVARHDYDIAGGRIHEWHLDAGEHWRLADVTGAPMCAWDSLGRRIRLRYDQRHRPTEEFISTGGGPERLSTRTRYGETVPGAAAANQRSRVVEVCDEAGRVTHDGYDFKGNLLATTRTLVADGYRHDLDWSTAVPLQARTYTSRTEYDAHDRPVQVSTPDGSVTTYGYNEAGFLESVSAVVHGQRTTYVEDIDYDAKGQRTLLRYGNGLRTEYTYDPLTLRLTRLRTTGGQDRQDLWYSHDPVGNLVAIRDDAQPTLFFNNNRVTAEASYTYDALYRLIEADGREQLGQAAGGEIGPGRPGPHPGDGAAMGRYRQRYGYDIAGNIERIAHTGTDPTAPGWTRRYQYTGNRLATTTLGAAAAESYGHNPLGQLTGMPHLPLLAWNDRSQLHATTQQVVSDGGRPELTYYLYGAGGQRVRKVTEGALSAAQVAAGVPPVKRTERIYLGTFEIYREYDGTGTGVSRERQTLHIMDDSVRVALVETVIRENATNMNNPTPAIRYQLGNQLGSAVLEVDAAGDILSYEEYHPYGTTAYAAGRGLAQVSLKRYRYTGKERDEESGLYYHGARYYAPWLGRWIAPDPAGNIDGLNRYAYALNSPTTGTDPTGTATKQKSKGVKPEYTFGKMNEDHTSELWDLQGVKYDEQITSDSGKSVYDRVRQSFDSEIPVGASLDDKARSLGAKRMSNGKLDLQAIKEAETASIIQHAKHTLESRRPEVMFYKLYQALGGEGDVAAFKAAVLERRAELVKMLGGKGKLSKSMRKLVKDTGFSRKELAAALQSPTDVPIAVTTRERIDQLIEHLKVKKAASEAKALVPETKAILKEGKLLATEAKAAGNEIKAVTAAGKAVKTEVTEAKALSKAVTLTTHVPTAGDFGGGAGEEQQTVTQEGLASIPFIGQFFSKTGDAYKEAGGALGGSTGTQQPVQKPAPTIYPGKKLQLKQFPSQ